MGETRDDQKSTKAAEIEREILGDRKFTLEEAVARMVGPGAMKGESPVARLRQAEIEIGLWLRANLHDSGGALEAVLNRHVNRSETLLTSYERPLAALASYCQSLLDSDFLLHEFVRDADVEWGRVMGERPHFERPDAAAHADDPYTVKSVRCTLNGLIQQLAVF